jgi:hypothetical protein
MIDTIVKLFRDIADTIESAIVAREESLDEFINSHHPTSISEVESLEDQYFKSSAMWR